MPQGFRVEGAEQLRILATELRASDRVMLRALRRNLRAVVAPIAGEVRAEAATFSTTIPSSITVRTQTSARKASVSIVALASRLPAGHESLARLQEFGSRGNGAVIRHPVFGTDTWVDQLAHPFMRPTIRKNLPAVELAMRAVLDEASAVVFHM